MRAVILALLVAGCATETAPVDSYCQDYQRVLPDGSELAGLKRPTKEAILANERKYVRDCVPGGLKLSPR